MVSWNLVAVVFDSHHIYGVKGKHLSIERKIKTLQEKGKGVLCVIHG